MQVVEHVAELLRPVDDRVLWLRALFFYHTAQRDAFYVVHYNAYHLAVVDNIYDSRQSGVVKLFQHIRFADGALNYYFVVPIPSIFLDFFYRPLFIKAYISCEVYFGHSALSYLSKYLVFSVEYLAH